MEYHHNDQYATNATEARAADYSVLGLPVILFDGARWQMASTDDLYEQQAAPIEAAMAKEAPLSLSLTAGFGEGGIALDITAQNMSSAVISGAELRAVVYEDLGRQERHYVARDVMPPISMAELAPGVEQQYEMVSSYSGSNLNVAVFVQAASGEGLQAVATDRPMTSVPVTTTWTPPPASSTGGNSIRVISMTPASPATLPLYSSGFVSTRTMDFSKVVVVTMECVITNPGGARVWALPYTDGLKTLGARYEGSDILPPGTTTITRYFSIYAEPARVDVIRLIMVNADDERLYTTYVPVDYLFTDQVE